MQIQNSTSVTLYKSYCCIHPGESIRVLNINGPKNTINLYSPYLGECSICSINGNLQIKSKGKLQVNIKLGKYCEKMIEITENC